MAVHLSSQVTKLQNLGKRSASEAGSTEKVRTLFAQRRKLNRIARDLFLLQNEDWRFCAQHNRESCEVVNVSRRLRYEVL